MTVYALVRPNDTVDRRATNVDPNVPTRNGWRWLPVEEVGNTAFDPKTHKKSGPVTTVESTRVVDTYTVSQLTQQELDDLAAQSVEDLNNGPLVKGLNSIYNEAVPANQQKDETQFKDWAKDQI